LDIVEFFTFFIIQKLVMPEIKWAKPIVRVNLGLNIIVNSG